MKFTFNTIAAESGEIVSTFLVFSAALGMVAKPPSMAKPLTAEPLMASKLPTAAKPLSLLLRLYFEGLACTVADPDTMS